MRLLSIHRVQPGTVLAGNVYLGEMRLLSAGVVLTRRLLEQLREHGVRTLYVSEDGEVGSRAEREADLISEKTRAEAGGVLRRYMDAARRRLTPSTRALSEVVTVILDEVLSNRAVLLEPGEMRATSDSVFGHSVTVCATASLVGIDMGLDQRDLKALALGAILHDVGKVRVPETIWDKPGPLTPEEFRQVQEHSLYGFEILRGHRELDLRSAHVAYQHHERWDGRGYPAGLAGERIHPFARITSVVDVFDALVTDRPYRSAWPRHLAVEFIRGQAGHMFDPEVVRAFLGRVAPYPVGTLVRLDTGELAEVVRLDQRRPARPIVRLLGARCAELDLGRTLDRRILGPVEEDGLPESPRADPFEGRGEY